MAIGSIAGLLNFAKGISTPLDNSDVNTAEGTATWDIPWDAGEDIVFEAGKKGPLKVRLDVYGGGFVECYKGARSGKTIYISVSDGTIYEDYEGKTNKGRDTHKELSSGQRAALEKFEKKVIDNFTQPAAAHKGPSPDDLGSGLANQAGEAIQNRASRLNGIE